MSKQERPRLKFWDGQEFELLRSSDFIEQKELKDYAVFFMRKVKQEPNPIPQVLLWDGVLLDCGWFVITRAYSTSYSSLAGHNQLGEYRSIEPREIIAIFRDGHPVWERGK